jgi:hypothetical protein
MHAVLLAVSLVLAAVFVGAALPKLALVIEAE